MSKNGYTKPFFMCARVVLNHRPQRYKRCALTPELLARNISPPYMTYLPILPHYIRNKDGFQAHMLKKIKKNVTIVSYATKKSRTTH